MKLKDLETISNKIDVAIEKRLQHTKPSQDTIKFMESIIEEKKSEQTKIALICQDISFIKTDIAEIKTSFKDLTSIFASKEQLSVVTTATETRLCKLENSSNFWKFFNPVFGAVLGSVMTFLVLHFLQSF